MGDKSTGDLRKMDLQQIECALRMRRPQLYADNANHAHKVDRVLERVTFPTR